MSTLRGLALWLVPPLLVSFGLTAVLHMSNGGDLAWSGMRPTIALGAVTLIFTIPGSALLALCFAWTEERSVPLLGRYVSIIALGGIAGGAALAFSPSIPIGCAYGLATATAWVGLHWLFYRRGDARA